jgi:hypothetical protein
MIGGFQQSKNGSKKGVVFRTAGSAAPRRVASTCHLHPNGPEVNRSFFMSFPYVCPEPVLAKRSFIYINGSKRPFLLTGRSTYRSNARRQYRLNAAWQMKNGALVSEFSGVRNDDLPRQAQDKQAQRN